EHDEGRLTAHRIFFGLPPGVSSLQQVSRPGATVTELAHIPHPLADGPCLLELQIPAGAAMRFRAGRFFMLCWSPPPARPRWARPSWASPRWASQPKRSVANPGGIGGIAEQSAASGASPKRSVANPGGIGGKRSVAKAACADDLRTHTRSRARARRRGSSSRLPATFRDAHGLAWEGPCLSVRAFTGTDALGGTRGRSRRDG